ncbi:phosphatidylserine decarboxylase [Halogranum gelatinilyticum]|uniref:Phosphatidylserine decarboxylase n=1 Tax=Halogranum gelatinilyticum TaxID=660521 RepID=A0A1G9P8Z3_9EURY|nr:protein sorting system archaetidylserine decarboxylase [Halogranum gelatinilyticum]SDL95266.1 phosphatidylserine decarboxylase [Halogranum gelatinilyticum]
MTGVTPGTWRYAAPPLLLAVPATVVAFPVGLALLLLGLGVVAFFRDPERTPPESGIVAPAHGKVSVIREEGERVRVGVFMNVTDVHVIRAPADGYVESVDRRPGAYKPAFSKDSDRNERVDVDFGTHEVSFIAGWFARRIHPYVGGGESVARGERLGHIAFGSRADVLLPEWVDIEDVAVENGQRVRAGETVVVETPAADD